MDEINAEAKEQIRAALERDDFDQIRSILDAVESAENPNIVKVEFTITEMKFLEQVRQDVQQPDIAQVLRLIIGNFRPGYLKARKGGQKAKA